MQALFSIGFRSMFAAATLFAAFSLFIWGQFWGLETTLPFSPFGSYLYWHPHELIMGVTLAILAGFLLTAVQNWTGIKTASSLNIKMLLVTWVAARLTMILDFQIPIALFILIQSIPGIFLAILIARPILFKRMARNYFAPLSILGLVFLDGYSLYSVHNGDNTSRLFYAQIMLILLVISIIASRVIPFFNANKLQIDKPIEPNALKITNIAGLLLLIFLYLSPLSIWNTIAIQMACVVISAASFARLYIWHHKDIWKEPMLYSLWLSYLLFAIGFLLMGFSEIFNIHSVALHVLAIGALGGICIAMLSRVSLGHTGRAITHDKIILLAFALLLLSLICRTLVIWLGGFEYNIVVLSAYAAASSFFILFLRFIKIWYQPRLNIRS